MRHLVLSVVGATTLVGVAWGVTVVGGEAGLTKAPTPLLTMPANWTYEVDDRSKHVWRLRAPDGALVFTYTPEN